VVKCLNYGESLWGKTAKLIVQLPDGEKENYFLKVRPRCQVEFFLFACTWTDFGQVVSLEDTGRVMCQGEFESLKAIDNATPGFCPKPYAWGRYSKEEPETYFILEEFRDIGKQVKASPFTS